jgi:hypothetical protein
VDLTTSASFLLPGSIPTAMGWVERADGSWFKRTQKTLPFQKEVALPLLIHLLARDGVVGISG